MPSTDKLWDLGDHSLGKHLVLRSYLHAWLPILGSWQGRIVFIDAFAGPGEYFGGEEGSPIIALRAFLDHAARHVIKAEVRFAFIERDPARSQHLKGVLAKFQGTLPENCHVQVITGTFDGTLTPLLDEIERSGIGLAPAFVMIDPFGISDTPMAVIQRLLRHQRSEVFISFMYESINRWKRSEEFPPHLDALFGSPDWRQAADVADPTKRKQAFYSLYERQLRAAGAAHVVKFELCDGGRHVYTIFHASKHPKACNLMKEAVWKIAPFGEYRFRGELSSADEYLFGADLRPFRRELREFAGVDWISIDALESFAMSDSTLFHCGQVKRVLRDMEAEGLLEIRPSDRKRRAKTFPPGTILRFRQA